MIRSGSALPGVVRAWPSRLTWAVFTWAAAAGAAGLFAGVALGRWHDYRTNAFDLAVIDQVVWNTAHGRWFETSLLPYNFAGQHFQPVLLAFLAPYWLGAGPPLLLVAQAAVAGLAAIPLYHAARRWGLGGGLAASLAAAYLANPYLHRALEYDFHPEVLVAMQVSGALWAIAAGRFRWAALLALLPLLCKEDAVFVSLALAGLIAWRGGRREGAAIAAMALAWSLVTVGLVMPALRDGEPSDLVARYAYLGGGGDGPLLVRIASHPWELVQALTGLNALWTAGLFLLVGAMPALARPWTVLALAPGIALAVVSAHPEQRDLELHYAAELVPLASVVAVVGLAVLARRFPAPQIAALVLVPAAAGFIFLSPFSPLVESPLDVGTPAPDEARRTALEAAVAFVPPHAVVAAQSGILSRLSHRETAYEFPPPEGVAPDWVVVDAAGHRSNYDYEARLAEVRATYTQVFSAAGVEVWRR